MRPVILRYRWCICRPRTCRARIVPAAGSDSAGWRAVLGRCWPEVGFVGRLGQGRVAWRRGHVRTRDLDATRSCLPFVFLRDDWCCEDRKRPVRGGCHGGGRSVRAGGAVTLEFSFPGGACALCGLCDAGPAPCGGIIPVCGHTASSDQTSAHTLPRPGFPRSPDSTRPDQNLDEMTARGTTLDLSPPHPATRR